MPDVRVGCQHAVVAAVVAVAQPVAVVAVLAIQTSAVVDVAVVAVVDVEAVVGPAVGPWSDWVGLVLLWSRPPVVCPARPSAC